MSLPLSCVQGNTDPAPASRFWLRKRWITAEVMRHNSGQRLLLGACLCRFTAQELALPFSFGQPWTLIFANSSSGQPVIRGRLQLEVALTQGTGSSQHLLPPAKGAAHLPSQIQARNSLQDGSQRQRQLHHRQRAEHKAGSRPGKRGALTLPWKPLRLPLPLLPRLR